MKRGKKYPTIALSYILMLATLLMPSASQAAIYVDKNVGENAVQDGTKANPFSSIKKALAEINDNHSKDKKIMVASGTYEGNITIPKGVSLVGAGAGKTSIQGSKGATVTISQGGALKKVTIKKGSVGILVAKNSSATIEDVTVTKTSKVGIEVAKSTKNTSKPVVIRDSKIFDNEGKGLYIQKSKINLNGNKISNNAQEGVDVRQGVKGTLKSNMIKSNKESGIELIIGKSNLDILNNTITNNKASGISTQFYSAYDSPGTVNISGSSIIKNNKFAIDCALPQGGRYPSNYWNTSITQSENKLTNNGKLFASRCEFM